MFSRLLLVVVALFWAVAANAQNSYRIQPGDLLSIEVLEDPSLNREALVLPDGSVSFPLVGSVRAAGRTTGTMQSLLAERLTPNFAAAPTVFVSVSTLNEEATEQFRSRGQIDIYVMGEVETPGMLEVDRGTTLLQALSQAGGFSDFAAKKRIQLRRTDPQTGTDVVYLFNYRAVEAGGRVNGRTILHNGDVIVVPQRRLFE